jgi:predicted Zn finger-like uncharacterized protein
VDLFTRCPGCETVFRVTTRHLQASGGQVRCGRCKTVFDAFASLTAKPPADSHGPTGSANDSSEPEAVRHQQALAENVSPTVPAAPPVPEREERARDGEDASVAGETDAAHSERLANDPATNLFEWEFKAAPRNARTGLWLTLSLLLLLIATVQAGYVFRTDVLVNVPQARPVYERVCQWLSCEMGLPRLTEQLHIDASDLQLVDPEQPNLVQLTALVRNRAPVPVEFPSLELTLTNAQEQVVARRVFLPAEYLSEPDAVAQGLGGRGELAVRLFLDTGPLRAAGYRIYLFYPA